MIPLEAKPDHNEALRRRLAKPPLVTIDTADRRIELVTRHGLFSARTLDEGTAMLLRELESLTPVARVLDLGCGYGAIGLTLAAKWPDSQVELLDVDIRAVESTTENIARNRLNNAAVTLSDGIRDLQDSRTDFDLVVSNLPAQAGNDAIDQLLLDAYDALRADGTLVVVTVNGLRRYLQRRLGDIFGRRQVAKIRQGARHTVIEAAKLRT